VKFEVFLWVPTPLRTEHVMNLVRKQFATLPAIGGTWWPWWGGKGGKEGDNKKRMDPYSQGKARGIVTFLTLKKHGGLGEGQREGEGWETRSALTLLLRIKQDASSLK